MIDKTKELPKIIEKLRKKFGNESGAKPIYSWLCENEVPAGWVLCPARRIARGTYTLVDDPSTVVKNSVAARRKSRTETPVGLDALKALPAQPEVESAPAPAVHLATVTPIKARQIAHRMVLDNLVPDRDRTYVPFGHFRDVMSIIDSRIFYPAFITGLSGNGKTVMVEQACARLKRNCIRVNITEETDEDDLIGGNTMIDGNVIFREGPVLAAMRTGSILILDEVDLNATKILCLQSIMEGKPYFNKKTGETIYPVLGFNVFATANTKGRGSDTGRYIGAKLMNEAFLERFPITFEQDYPSAAVEVKILMNNFAQLDLVSDETNKFSENLARWAEIIRKSYKEQAVDDVISTRRLVSIVRAYAIFRIRMKAINLCLARFDDSVKEIFSELYTKVDAEASNDTPVDVVICGGDVDD